MRLRSHPLVKSLFEFKGNQKACVWTEPLWGIPFNLYAPYASLYMIALGLTESQIGLIISIGMVCQVFSALFGGAITDKLGRKRTTFIFDVLSWSIPCLIWAVAQNFTYFLVAAVINSLWRITSNSWSCLMVEDCDPKELVNLYSWIQIAGLLSAFFAPAAGIFVGKYGVVPTVRGLYFLAFAVMTTKFIILNAFATETKQGQVRRIETANQSIFALLGGYGDVFKQILHTPETMLTLGIMLIMSIVTTINSSFWSIIVTETIQIPSGHIAMFPFLKSIVMLLFFFLVTPKISSMHFQRPLLTGFGSFLLSQSVLVTAPIGSYLSLVISIILEACAFALIYPFMDSLAVVTIDAKERARILSIINVIIIVLTSPFGWLAGTLSELNHRLPFITNISLFVIGITLIYRAGSRQGRRHPSEAA